MGKTPSGIETQTKLSYTDAMTDRHAVYLQLFHWDTKESRQECEASDLLQKVFLHGLYFNPGIYLKCPFRHNVLVSFYSLAASYIHIINRSDFHPSLLPYWSPSLSNNKPSSSSHVFSFQSLLTYQYKFLKLHIVEENGARTCTIRDLWFCIPLVPLRGMELMDILRLMEATFGILSRM